MSDWTGNSNSIWKTLGASNHSDNDRHPQDYYATDPCAARLLLEVEPLDHLIWECACGERHLAKVFEEYGHFVRSSDIVNRCGNEIFNFLSDYNKSWYGDIVTNPPYKYATEFIYKALSIIPEGNKIAMFLKVQFLEGKQRRKLFDLYPPKVIYVASSRIMCAKNGEFEQMRKGGGSAVAYAWFVWQKGYKGDTIVKWIN